MTVQCCGESHMTVFCPHCGRKLKDVEPLASLLEHVRGQLQGAQSRAANTDQYDCAYYQSVPERRRRQEAQDQARVARWAAWAAALEEVLKERRGT